MTNKNIYTQLNLCNFPIVEKDSFNPQFKKADGKPTYASLPSVLNTVVPVLKQHGIVISSYIKEDNPDILVVSLTHGETNTSLSSHVKLLDMSTMQKWGGSVTFGTRYGVLSLLGIAADIDDDGNIASGVGLASTKGSSDTVKKAFDAPTLSNTERMRLVHELHGLWEMKEGSVRAETDDVKERARRANAIRLFENDLKDITDVGITALKTWLSEL